MGILDDMDLDNVPEIRPVDEGEYEVRITSAEDYISKRTGKAMIRVMFEICGEPNSDIIFHYIVLPDVDDDDRKRNNKLRRIKSFLKAFSISKGDDYPEWVGKTAWALVGSSVDEQTGEVRNEIRRFIVGS